MEGESWMPYMDFIKTFTQLEVVHLDSETARDEPSMGSKQRWNMRFYSGAWQRGVTAGGCRNNSGEQSGCCPVSSLMPGRHSSRHPKGYLVPFAVS